MRFVKKGLSVLFVLVFLLALCSCGTGKGEELVGKWATEIDFSGLGDLDGAMGEEFADFDKTFNLTLVFEFKADKTYTLTYDEESAKKTQEEWKERLFPFMMGMLLEQATVLEMTEEEFKTTFEEQTGTTLEDYIQTTLAELDIISELPAMNSAGYYKVLGDRLFMSDTESFDDASYDVFSVSGDTFTLKSTSDAAENMEFSELYPLVFKRVK